MISSKLLRCFFIVFICYANSAFSQDQPESKFGWQLGVQTWSFNRFTLAEAIDKAKSVGVKYIQAFPGQKIGGGIEGELDFKKIDKETEKKVLQLLKDKGIVMVSYGVAGPKNIDEWKQLFEFAKDMDLESVAAEPSFDILPAVSGLAEQYKIRVAIHNHPRPTHYWSPDTTLAALTIASSKYVGVNADIGHWVRSGLNPVECLQKLQGHIFALHLKDLNEKSPAAHDVVWGTGVSDVDGVLVELNRQNFKGPIFAEYEYHWENNTQEIAESIKNLRENKKNLNNRQSVERIVWKDCNKLF